MEPDNGEPPDRTYTVPVMNMGGVNHLEFDLTFVRKPAPVPSNAKGVQVCDQNGDPL